MALAVVKHIHIVKVIGSRMGWSPAAGYQFPGAFMTLREGVDDLIHFLDQM